MNMEAVFRALARALVELVFAPECACGEAGVWLCERCGRTLRAGFRPCADVPDVLTLIKPIDLATGVVAELPRFQIFTLGEYQGRLRQLILRLKNHGQLSYLPELVPGVKAAIAEIMRAYFAVSPAELNRQQAVVLAPAPSNWWRVYRRGQNHVRQLAEKAAKENSLAVKPKWLTKTGKISRNLSGRGRRQATQHSIRLRRAARTKPCAVILIDDVLTTGSTLASCADALEKAGHTVIGAICLAQAPKPQHRTKSPEFTQQHQA